MYAGIVFTVCCEPYLESEYGVDYISETPVKLLDRLLYGQREHLDEEVHSQHLLYHQLHPCQRPAPVLVCSPVPPSKLIWPIFSDRHPGNFICSCLAAG